MRARSLRYLIHWALACGCLLAGLQGAAAFPQDPDRGDAAAAMRKFTQGIARYVALRARFEEPLPSFDARRDAWSLMLTRRYLASAIRTARPRAGHAEILIDALPGAFPAW